MWVFDGTNIVPVNLPASATQGQRKPAQSSARGTRSSRGSNAEDGLDALAQLLGGAMRPATTRGSAAAATQPMGRPSAPAACRQPQPSKPSRGPSYPAYVLNAYGQPVPNPYAFAESEEEEGEEEDAGSNDWCSDSEQEQEEYEPHFVYQPAAARSSTAARSAQPPRAQQRQQQAAAAEEPQPQIYLVPDPRRPGIYMPVALAPSAPSQQPAAAPTPASKRAGSTSGSRVTAEPTPARRAPAVSQPAAAAAVSQQHTTQPKVIPVVVSQLPHQAVPVSSRASQPASQPAVTVTAQREPSTHLVLRPSMELSLSRDPSVATSLSQQAPHRHSRHGHGIPVHTAGGTHHVKLGKPGHSKAAATSPTSASASVSASAAAGAAAPSASFPHPEGPGTPPQIRSSAQPQPAAGSAAGRSTVTTASGMTRSQAARVIQKWWRGHIVRAGSSTTGASPIRALSTLNANLRAACAKFYEYLAASEGNISHKQYLEINELAMRCVLGVDGVSVRAPELRAARKRLTARALSLQDQVQAAYAASSKSLKAMTRAASLRTASAASPAPAAAATCAAPSPAAAPSPEAAPPAEPAARAEQQQLQQQAEEAASSNKATSACEPCTSLPQRTPAAAAATATAASAVPGVTSSTPGVTQTLAGSTMTRENSEGWSKLAAAVAALGLQMPSAGAEEEVAGHLQQPQAYTAAAHLEAADVSTSSSSFSTPPPSPTAAAAAAAVAEAASRSGGKAGKGSRGKGRPTSPFAALSQMPSVLEQEEEEVTSQQDSMQDVSQPLSQGASQDQDQEQLLDTNSDASTASSSVASSSVTASDADADSDAQCVRVMKGVSQLAGLSQQELSRRVRVVLRCPGDMVDSSTQTD